jgi:hypothetical protein
MVSGMGVTFPEGVTLNRFLPHRRRFVPIFLAGPIRGWGVSTVILTATDKRLDSQRLQRFAGAVPTH